MLLRARSFGSDQFARSRMVQSDARGVVSKRDPVFFKRTLDPPVGLSADLELLARRCLHLAAEYLDPGVDAVELGLERHVDDLGELGVRDHLKPNLLDQFSNALAVDSYRKRDFEFVDDPVARVVADAAKRAIRDEMQRSVLMPQCQGAERDSLYVTLCVTALDVIANAEHILDQIAGAAKEIAHQGLCAKADRYAHHAGAGKQRQNIQPQRRQRAHQRNRPDHQFAHSAQQRLNSSRPALRAALFAAQFDREAGLEEKPRIPPDE